MQRSIAAFLVIAVVTLSGCGGCDDGQITPAREFNKTHGGKTITPHGEIVTGSARDTDDGSIQYQTSDGQSWQVEPSSNGELGTPERVNSGN